MHCLSASAHVLFCLLELPALSDYFLSMPVFFLLLIVRPMKIYCTCQEGEYLVAVCCVPRLIVLNIISQHPPFGHRQYQECSRNQLYSHTK